MKLTNFNRFLLAELAKKSAKEESYIRMFSAPNNYYQVALGQREPEENDFYDIATYLDISVDYLISIYMDEGVAVFIEPFAEKVATLLEEINEDQNAIDQIEKDLK